MGTLVVKSLLKEAFDKGADEVHIHAQIRSRTSIKVGFVPYGKPFYEAGIEHISMAAYRPDFKITDTAPSSET